MSDHKDTIQSVSEGDKFHFYDPSVEEWIDSEILDIDVARSSYANTTVTFSDQDLDGGRLEGTMHKRSLKEKIRNSDKKFHTGSMEECDMPHE